MKALGRGVRKDGEGAGRLEARGVDVQGTSGRADE